MMQTGNLIRQSEPVAWEAIFIGTVVSAVSAWLCIHFFLKLIERTGMWPFVVYRLLLGAVLLWMFV